MELAKRWELIRPGNKSPAPMKKRNRGKYEITQTLGPRP
jgi:hypothetical protein